jgi:hypothetical protein
MKKLIATIVCLGMIGFAGLANATPYSFDMGADSSVDTSGTVDVLQMYALMNTDLDDVLFDLNVGESYDFYFATIGTDEIALGSEDYDTGTLTAILDFDNPDIDQSVLGGSQGMTTIITYGTVFYTYTLSGWSVVWADPVIVDFGNGGQLTIELDDLIHSAFGGDPSGSEDVYARVTLNTAPSPVPEPSTVMLVGTGLLGMIAFGRKRFNKKA